MLISCHRTQAYTSVLIWREIEKDPNYLFPIFNKNCASHVLNCGYLDVQPMWCFATQMKDWEQ